MRISIDRSIFDTPISRKDVVDELLTCIVELRSYKTEEDLNTRFYRTDEFLRYLEEMEKQEFKDNPEYRESDLTTKEFMPAVRESFEAEKKYITKRRALRRERFGAVV